jgi:hypothetical protein
MMNQTYRRKNNIAADEHDPKLDALAPLTAFADIRTLKDFRVCATQNPPYASHNWRGKNRKIYELAHFNVRAIRPSF